MREFNPNDALEEANSVLETHDLFLQLGTQNVRVVRAVVFIGPANLVRDQLAQSLPDGERKFGNLIIRVVTGPVAVDQGGKP